MICPDGFDDDQYGYYLSQAKEILSSGLTDNLTEDHKQALEKERKDELC